MNPAGTPVQEQDATTLIRQAFNANLHVEITEKLDFVKETFKSKDGTDMLQRAPLAITQQEDALSGFQDSCHNCLPYLAQSDLPNH